MQSTPNLAKPDRCSDCAGYSSSISTGFVPADSLEKAETAKIGILAEAGGETEALQSLPLCGTTGKLFFSEIAEPLGLTRDDIFLDNTLRCRPRNNIYPSGKLGENMLIHCRQWDAPLDTFNPTVVVICYHFTYSLIRVKTVRYSARNAVAKALRLSKEGHRVLIASGDKAFKLLFPRLEGNVSKWDGKHFFVEWRPSSRSIAPIDFIEERERRTAAPKPKLRQLLKEIKKR